MTWFAVPALVALLIKLFLIVGKRKLIVENQLWFYFVVIFAINNCAELLVLCSPDISTAPILSKAYHPTAIAVLFYCLIYSMGSAKSALDKFVSTAAALSALMLSIGIMLTDYVVVGGTSFGNFVTAVRGDYYHLFSAYVLVMCLLIVVVLLRNFFFSKIESKKIEALWVAIALTPSLIITSTCVVLLYFQFNFNVLFLTPIGSTLFLVVTLLSYSNGLNRKDPRKFIPFTREFKLSRAVSRAENGFLTRDLTLSEASNEFEKALLSYVSEREVGNITKIAERAGLARSSMYQKGIRLGLDWKSFRE